MLNINGRDYFLTIHPAKFYTEGSCSSLGGGHVEIVKIDQLSHIGNNRLYLSRASPRSYRVSDSEGLMKSQVFDYVINKPDPSRLMSISILLGKYI